MTNAGRKFWALMMIFTIATIGLLGKFLTGTDFTTLIGGSFFVYVTGNVSQKWATDKK